MMRFESKAGNVDNLRFFVKDGEVDLPSAVIDRQVAAIDGGYEVTLKSDKFAKAVWVSFGEPGVNFSDNFFYLLPGVEKKVTVRTDLDQASFSNRLEIKYQR